MNRYVITGPHHDSDGRWEARALGVPGIFGHGESAAEALASLEEALREQVPAPVAVFTCAEQYEPAARRGSTHHCDRQEDHDDPHHCPMCGSEWTGHRGEPGSVVRTASASAEPAS